MTPDIGEHMSRYAWLEQQLDREDLTDTEFNSYNKELNDLHASQEERRLKREQVLAEQRREEQEQIALDKILSLTEDEVEKMYVAFYSDHFANAMTYEEWYAKSMRYYHIMGDFTVVSKARSVNTEERVEHVNLAHAKHTILKRIKHKFYDHFVRGRDFAWEIEQGEVSDTKI
jgi:hypothetical protein